MFTWTNNVEKSSYHGPDFPVIAKNELRDNGPKKKEFQRNRHTAHTDSQRRQCGDYDGGTSRDSESVLGDIATPTRSDRKHAHSWKEFTDFETELKEKGALVNCIDCEVDQKAM